MPRDLASGGPTRDDVRAVGAGRDSAQDDPGFAARFRVVFVLRDVEGLSTEETAETLGLSVPAVKSRLLRARLQLRERLSRYFRKNGDGTK